MADSRPNAVRHKTTTFRLIADLGGAAERPDAIALIEWMLRFVNRQPQPDEGDYGLTPRHRAMTEIDRAFTKALRQVARMTSQRKSKDRQARELTVADRFVTEIRLLLAALHGNRDRDLPESLQAAISDHFRSSASVSPDFGADSAQFVLRVEWDIKTPRSRVYASLALLAASRELRGRLGRCALSECGLYFLDDVSRGGKRKLFCSEGHSDIGRTRQYRERLKTHHPKSRKDK